MCGIVGVFQHQWNQDAANGFVSRQLDEISYRGPDGRGVYYTEDVALGHARLSIIDLSSGSQPMSTADGRFTIVFNGEIYNYLELRDELTATGQVFATHSDTEVLLLGYREWGIEMLSRINGMFAFALYDRERKSLFCARDPLGQKPFYYFRSSGAFYFASEVKAFNPLADFSRTVDHGAIAAYLRFEALYHDETMFNGVKKLPPGHFLTVDSRELNVDTYFHSVPRDVLKDPHDAINQIDSLLQDAVKIAFRADVPVGVLLSGGLDSSLVLAVLRKTLPTADITAFHVHMADDATFDESAYARNIASHCKSNYVQHDFTLADMAETARSVLPRLDEPQADPGLLAKYIVCHEISKQRKVALTGDGADELFYGYISFKAERIAHWYRHLPSFWHRFIAPLLVRALPTKFDYMSLDFIGQQFLRGFPAEDALRNANWTNAFLERELVSVLNAPNLILQQRSVTFLRDIAKDSYVSGYLGRLAYQYQRTYLPEYVLKNSDRVAMLNAVELRTPYLDRRLVRLANSIADDVKMPGYDTKGLLKSVALRYLPDELVYRKKIGFTVPVARLIREKLREEIQDLLSPEHLKRQGLFKSEPIQAILTRHFSGKRNHYKQIWTLYTVQKWLIENKLG